MKKIIMTGSHGRVGTALMKDLKDEYEIYEINRSGQASNSSLLADVSDFEELKQAFEKIGPVEAVIHLAGDPRVDADWQSVARNNINGTRNVYESARIMGIKKVIFASTNHVTGAYEGIPPRLHLEDKPKMIRADDPIAPDSDYAVSKACGEALAKKYWEMDGIKSVCIRIGSVNEENDPIIDKRRMKTWLSHRDLGQLARAGLKSEKGFGIYYGVSNNEGKFWDIENARNELGYQPQDNAAMRLEKDQ